jgi:hypothetical protein
MIGTTILRLDVARPFEQVPGLDISEDDAEALVAAGAAEWREYELPPAMTLLMDLEVRGFAYPVGTQLQVGGHITEQEAMLLLFAFTHLPDRAVVSFPSGGVG